MIVRLAYPAVKPLAGAAARDHVSLKDTVSVPTQWFGMRDASGVYIVAGLLVRRGQGRIRGVWCRPDYRGRGLSVRLMDHLVTVAQDQGCCALTQLASSPSWWVNERGWHVTRALSNGHAWLEKHI